MAKQTAYTSKSKSEDTKSDDTETEEEQPLFRSQVLAEQRNQWLGNVLIASPLSHTVYALFATVTATLVLLALFLGDYTRKERVTGWLVPQQGLVKLYSPQSGIALQVSVADGALVQSGDTLAVVSTELQSQARGATQGEIIQRLEQRRDSLQADAPLIIQLHEQQRDSLGGRVEITVRELQLRQEELAVQQQRVSLAEKSVERLRSGRKSGAVSEEQWRESENDRLQQTMRLRELQRDLAINDRELQNLNTRREALPLEHQRQLLENERAISSLQQQLAEAESRREIVLSAPQSGTVAALQIKPGTNVNAELPLLSIIPEGSELEAQLYLPTRAIGFVEEGQPVLLRYRAFPYQKFGHYKGTIAEVSRSTVNMAQHSVQAIGSVVEQMNNEPVYPVKVKLEQQNVNAYGKAIALQPGMALEADILIEKRQLIEWVLEPLYTLTGRSSA